MMITVTAIIYATLIGPYEVLSGFALVTNPLAAHRRPRRLRGDGRASGAVRRHYVGDAGTRPADPGRVGGVDARARRLHAPVPLRLRECVAPRLRAGRHQHRRDLDRRPAFHGALRGRGLADSHGFPAEIAFSTANGELFLRGILVIDGAGISRLVWSGFADWSYKVVDCYVS